MYRYALLTILGTSTLACSKPAREPLAPIEPPRGAPTEPMDLGRWQPATSSPHRPSDVLEPGLMRLCGVPDAALQSVAAVLAAEGSSGGTPLDMPRLEFELRVAGSPYVWPHLWTVSGHTLDPGDVAARFARWLDTFSDGGQRRCGMARSRTEDDREVIVAVAVDVMADIMPVPTRSSVGRWLDLQAQLLVPTHGASVVLLGPRGRPSTITSHVSQGTVKAAFAPSAPGRWLAQVVALTDAGPRPVARAVVHVDTAPPQQWVSRPVPGEDAAIPHAPPQRSLASMVAAARASEGVRRLQRSSRLQQVAQAHAEAMMRAQRLGHDVGRGSVRDRLTAAGIDVATGGENVARAGSIERAHRVLWESPSHRETLLYDEYDAFGVGVALEDDGTVWVCQVFARF